MLADVGLLGLPNAGKSTLIAAVSNARPKIADYPFTTLHPNLGVVRIAPGKSFVIADIPGLIEGAADGAGLGHQFLRHLQRTRLLLHLVDLVPYDPDADPVRDARAIVNELRRYDPELAAKPRWLVLNKIDMVPQDERDQRVDAIVTALKKGRGRNAVKVDRVFAISGLTREGCEPLMLAIYDYLRIDSAARSERDRRALRCAGRTTRMAEPRDRPAREARACGRAGRGGLRRSDRRGSRACARHGAGIARRASRRRQGRLQPGDQRGSRTRRAGHLAVGARRSRACARSARMSSWSPPARSPRG